MAIGKTSLFLAIVLMYVLSPVVNIVVVTAKPQVPCYFVFGDSAADPGNNNNLRTSGKANYKPYGIDFPGGLSTGRFSNNRTYVDVITELLGFDHFIPPFNESMDEQGASQGVNYASGGAGILYETGRRNWGEVISFDQQIRLHQQVVEKVAHKVDLTKCLYTIGLGNNDYILTYPTYPTYIVFTPTQFAHRLIHDYRAHIKTLYGLGARKMALFLLVEGIHSSSIFNNLVASLVDELNHGLTGAHFIYFNSNVVDLSAFTNQAHEYNVHHRPAPCCVVSANGVLCEPLATPCSNRAQNFLWDGVHPTDAVNAILGGRAYTATSTREAYPFDISHLVKL